MKRWRARRAIVIACMLGVVAVRAADLAPDQAILKDYEAQIAQLDGEDPRSPQALETHLRYADYLAKQAGEDCDARLRTAQMHLKAAQRNVALSVVVPQGLARAADVDYQIHAALASCAATSDAARTGELKAALDSAQRAASLYRETFDYPSMVTEQYNAAVIRQRLGDIPAAKSALEALIQADHEYGFLDDADENQQLLQKLSPSSVPTSSPPDVTERSATLKLAWQQGDRGVTMTAKSSRVFGSAVAEARAERTLTRRARTTYRGWLVGYQSLASHYASDPLPAGASAEASLMNGLAGALLEFHDINLASPGKGHPGGDFAETTDRDAFRLRMQADLRSAALGPAFETAVKALMSPLAVEGRAAVAFNLETGAWPDATLEQGQWYDMAILLPLPFAPLNFVVYDIQFAFTRKLACPGDRKLGCIELVLRAVPDETDLKSTIRTLQNALHLPHGAALRAWSTMYMRLITDPDTLQAYQWDLRQQFYASPSNKPGDALIGADDTHVELGALVEVR